MCAPVPLNGVLHSPFLGRSNALSHSGGNPTHVRLVVCAGKMAIAGDEGTKSKAVNQSVSVPRCGPGVALRKSASPQRHIDRCLWM